MRMKMTLGQLRRTISEAVGASMLDRAVALATELHKDQKDKGGKAYIDHPLRVMRNVKSKGYGDEVATIAVLHDTVEDTDLTLEQVAQEFGARVASGVRLLSKLPGEKYEAFVDRIISSGNKDAMQVKLADLEDNMDVSRLSREPDEWDNRRLTRYQAAFKKISQALGA